MNDWDGTLTDYVLFIECLVLSVRLWKSPTEKLAQGRLWGHLFLALSLAAFAGGTYHGFLNRFSIETSQYIWFLTMAFIGVVSSHLWILNCRLFHNGNHIKVVQRIVWVAFTIYLLIAIFVSAQFFVSIIFYLPPVLYFTFQSAMRYVFLPANDPYRRAYGWFVLAFGMVLLASVGQQLGLAIHTDYFDHNATFHLVQMMAFYILYRGARHSLAHPSLEPQQ